MRPIAITKTLVAAVVNNIAQSQSVLANANFNLNGSAVSGGVATLDTQRRVLITSAGNDSAANFTVFGTNQSGAIIQETLLGANIGAVATNQDFFTVTKVTVDRNTAGTVQVGTNGVGSTPFLLIDPHVTPTMIGIGVVVSGTVNFTVEYTYDDFTNLAPGVFPTVFSISALSTKTANTDSVLQQTVRGVRLTLNSNTPPGQATMTLIQAGIRQ